MSKPNEATLSSICWNVTGSTICWSGLYLALARTKFAHQSPEFFCRLVTMIHALVAVVLSANCYWQGPDPYTNPGEKNTAQHDTALVISLGYFIFDLAWCLYHQSEAAIMLIHHMVSVVSLSVVLLERTSGAEAVGGILSLEITNPLLQLRWFLRTAGYGRTLAHTVIELLFVVFFIVMRLGFGTALTYSIVTSDKVQRDVKLCSLMLYLISLAFIIYLFRFIKRKYANK